MPTLTIPTPPEFRFRSTLLSHGWIQLAPFAHDAEYYTLERTQKLSDGNLVHLQIRAGENDSLLVSVEGVGRISAAQRKDITLIVGHIFNLGLDLNDFYDLLRGESRYAWVEASGAGRLLRSPTVWEDLAKTLMTTNTTWNMTRQMVSRLTALGEVFSDVRHAFPTPERIAAIPPDELDGLIRAGYRTAYLHELAVNIVSGRVNVEEWGEIHLPAKDLFKLVTSLKGFGPYAAGTVLKLLGSFDELALDTVARGMFAEVYNKGEKAPDSTVQKHYTRYGEWRGLVIWVDIMRQWFTE